MLPPTHMAGNPHPRERDDDHDANLETRVSGTGDSSWGTLSAAWYGSKSSAASDWMAGTEGSYAINGWLYSNQDASFGVYWHNNYQPRQPKLEPHRSVNHSLCEPP